MTALSKISCPTVKEFSNRVCIYSACSKLLLEDSTKSRATVTKTLGTGSPLWMAPEIMSGKHGKAHYSYKVDIYSFGMVMYEVFSRELPFYDVEDASAFDLLNMVAAGDRPSIPADCDAPSGYISLMEMCWSADPRDRPDFAKVISVLDQLYSPVSDDIIPVEHDSNDESCSMVDTWDSKA